MISLDFFRIFMIFFRNFLSFLDFHRIFVFVFYKFFDFFYFKFFIIFKRKTTGEYYGRYLRVVISLVILSYTHPGPLGFYLIPILTCSFFFYPQLHNPS
ncbi:hypothetical protein HanRHA438_Chr04g0180061 [Helianthus annuus]|nr:hypothetical protein HanRHA438_Chr04g0180061 [Helianthus annuus]